MPCAGEAAVTPDGSADNTVRPARLAQALLAAMTRRGAPQHHASPLVGRDYAVLQRSADLLHFYHLLGELVAAHTRPHQAITAALASGKVSICSPLYQLFLSSSPVISQITCLLIVLLSPCSIRKKAKCKAASVGVRQDGVVAFLLQDAASLTKALAVAMAKRNWTAGQLCDLPFGVALPLQLALLRGRQLCNPGTHTAPPSHTCKPCCTLLCWVYMTVRLSGQLSVQSPSWSETHLPFH